MVSVLNEDNVRAMIIYIAEKIIENKPLLTETDSKIGDGDHGIGMAAGMKKAKEAVSAAENTGNAFSLFEKAGKAMLMSMGGASGVIFATMFMAGAKGSPAKAELSPQDLALMMERSLAAVKERGKAQPGDKTMVDAFEPAVEAMKKNQENLLPMLKAAAEAAARGVEATKQYRAKFGRAKSLMERAVGFQDAGATSVWIIFRSMAEFAEH